jgi:DNA polymerase I-like protein with 3'-5' exonuclease and polymerase domains
VFEEEELDSRVIGIIHDSVVINVKKGEVEIIPELVVSTMEGMKYPWLDVPLVADVKLGKSWGEAKEIQV